MALRAGDWQCKNTITGISPIFQGNKNKKSKSDSKETGFFKGCLDICWYFWMFWIMICPTNIQSTQKVSIFGSVLGESGPARIRKSPPKDEKTGPCLQLRPIGHRKKNRCNGSNAPMICVVHLSLTQPTHWCHPKRPKKSLDESCESFNKWLECFKQTKTW